MDQRDTLSMVAGYLPGADLHSLAGTAKQKAAVAIAEARRRPRCDDCGRLARDPSGYCGSVDDTRYIWCVECEAAQLASWKRHEEECRELQMEGETHLLRENRPFCS